MDGCVAGDARGKLCVCGGGGEKDQEKCTLDRPIFSDQYNQSLHCQAFLSVLMVMLTLSKQFAALNLLYAFVRRFIYIVHMY